MTPLFLRNSHISIFQSPSPTFTHIISPLPPEIKMLKISLRPEP